MDTLLLNFNYPPDINYCTVIFPQKDNMLTFYADFYNYAISLTCDVTLRCVFFCALNFVTDFVYRRVQVF